MQRTVAYFYPDSDIAESVKMFQDRVNQIRGFYFTRDNVKSVEELPSSDNYALYFLFNDTEEEGRVYIGQLTNGIKRINEHARNKEFWSYCIIFITDNNSFDKLVIDYLEHSFIKKFQKSAYTITNIAMQEIQNQTLVFMIRQLSICILTR